MKTVKVRKLFNGKISIRDYVVEEAIQANQPIEVLFEKKSMVISPSELLQGTSNNYKFTSKWDNKEYTLVDFDFKPTEQLQLL